MTGKRSQKSGVRSQKSEVRSQESEDRMLAMVGTKLLKVHISIRIRKDSGRFRLLTPGF